MGVNISLLGGLEVTVDGTAVPPRDWKGRQAAGLVKLLALAPERRLHRERVLDALWPDLLVDDAAPRLHKAAHYARRAMGSPGSVVLSGDVVALWPPQADVTVDVEKFSQLAETALVQEDPAQAESALAVYRGDLLPDDLYEPWSEGPRERLRSLQRDLLRLAGRWEDLATLDPADEEAQVALIRRLAARGDRSGALRQFERLERALSTELGLRPSPAARALHAELVAHEAPRDGSVPAAGAPGPVGRDQELDQVRALMDGLPLTGTRMLFVSGPPGIGKTAVAAAALEAGRLRGMRTGWGTSGGSEAPWPYASVLEALADLSRRHPTLLDGLDDSLREEIEHALGGRDLSWAAGARGGHQRLFVAAAELLRLAAAGSGAVLVVDDAHCADDASLRLLHYLSRATVTEAVLLVVAYRADCCPSELTTLHRAVAGRGLAAELPLGALSAQDVEALVRRHAPHADDDVVAQIRDACAGVPLTAVELSRVAGAPGAAPSLAELWLHGLSPEALAAVRAVAVLGATFDTDEFVAVCGSGEAHAFAVLDELIAGRVLVRSERGFRFRHALMRDAVLAGVPPHRRQASHRQAASALDALGAPAARIAHHLLESGARAQAVPYVITAAQTEGALGAYRDALVMLERVRTLATGQHRTRLLALRADLLLACGDLSAVDAYRAALAEAGAAQHPRLRAQLARAALFAGDLETAADALEGLELDGGSADGDILVARGNLAIVRGDLDAAEEAAELARRRLSMGAGDDWRLFDIVGLQGLVAHKRGRWYERMLIELRRGRERPELTTGIFDSHLCVAEYLLYGPTPYEEVLRLAADLRATAERAGVLRAVGFATALRGEAALLHGDLDLAEAELTEAIALHHDLGMPGGEAHSMQRLAELRLARGDRDGANLLLTRALPLARWSIIVPHVLQRIFGTMIDAAPDAEAARTVVHRGVATMGQEDSCLFCSIMFDVPAARACAAVGDLEAAHRHLAAAESSARMWEGTAMQAAILETRGHVIAAEGDAEGGRRLRQEAAVMFDACGQPLDAARCRVAA